MKRYLISLGLVAMLTGLLAVNIIETSFEPEDGWETHATGDWTDTTEDGTWSGHGMYVNWDNAYTGNHKAGMNTTGDWLQTPVMTNPGTLSFYCRKSGLTSDWTVVVEASVDGSSWSAYGAPVVASQIGIEYSLHSVSLDLSGDYYLRWRMSQRSGGSLYLDEIILTDVAANLEVDFLCDPEFGFPPLEVQFFELATGGSQPYDYLWDFGDGGTSVLANPTHIYSQTGLYAVSLTITDDEELTLAEVKEDLVFVTTGGDDYYDSVQDLSGQELSDALSDLIDTNSNTDYYDSRLHMFGTFDNENDLVRGVYTGYDFYVPQGQMPPDSDLLNCEHTYCQSWYNYESIPKADVHHLFPTDTGVNSSRGNIPFGDVVTPVVTYSGYNGYQSYKGYDAQSAMIFEPADQHKGDCARAMLYFSVRYEMGLTQGGVDMLPALLQWHQDDPVSQKEIDRNWDIFDYQWNRNPFIDHPEYVGYIWLGQFPGAVVQFAVASAQINETDGSVSLSLAIENPATYTATEATVALTAGDSADVGGFTSQQVVFPASSGQAQLLNITITDDTLMEGLESLTFSITSVSGGSNAQAGEQDEYLLTILDDDIPAPLATAASQVAPSSFIANWTECAGVDSYELDVSVEQNFASFLPGYEANPVVTVFCPVTGLISDTTYYYRVRAVFNAQTGGDSNVISVQTQSGGQYATQAIISEYIEGSSWNKAIEIFNGTGAAIDLSQYSLKKQTNGAGDFGNELALSGVLPHDQAYLIVNTQANATLLSLADMTTNGQAMQFNGNDAVALFFGEAMLDVVGWVDDTNSWGQNMTLVRNSSVLSPATLYAPAQWAQYAQDTFAYAGWHQMDYPQAATPPQNIVITISGDDVTLSWDAATARNRTVIYRVYRSDDVLTNDWGEPIGSTFDTYYTDENAAQATRYYYYLTAEGEQ